LAGGLACGALGLLFLPEVIDPIAHSPKGSSEQDHFQDL
jgi:hypothetical protein